MKRSLLIGAALVFSLTAVGCSDDDNDDGQTTGDGGVDSGLRLDGSVIDGGIDSSTPAGDAGHDGGRDAG